MRARLNINKKAVLRLVIIMLLIFGPVAAIAAKELIVSNQDKEKLTEFERQKSEKLAEITAGYKSFTEEEAKKAQEEHAKLQSLIAADGLSASNPRQDCSNLENREAIVITDSMCSYRVRADGSVNMAVVFVKEANFSHKQKIAKLTGPSDSKASLNYINTYIKKEAKRNKSDGVKIDLKFFGPYKASSSLPAYDDDLENYQTIVDALQETSKDNKVPESDFDLVHYVFMGHSGFRSFALPEDHRAFTDVTDDFDATATFIHETLHLFGASDKYEDGECESRGRSDPFKKSSSTIGLYDIMCSTYEGLDKLNINTITAREIGWIR